MLASEEQFANFPAHLEGTDMKSIKRFVIGLVGLSTLCGAPAQAEKWVYVTQREADADTYKTTYSIDVDSLDSLDSSGDGIFRIWQKEEIERSSNTVIFSLYDFDCAKREMSLLFWERYVDEYPDEVHAWDGWQARTQSVLAGSVSEEIFKAACALNARP